MKRYLGSTVYDAITKNTEKKRRRLAIVFVGLSL